MRVRNGALVVSGKAGLMDVKSIMYHFRLSSASPLLSSFPFMCVSVSLSLLSEGRGLGISACRHTQQFPFSFSNLPFSRPMTDEAWSRNYEGVDEPIRDGDAVLA